MTFTYFLVVKGYFADICEMGKEEGGMPLHGLAAAVAVRVPGIASHTLTLEPTLEVAANLRADAWLQTFVNICRNNVIITSLHLLSTLRLDF